MSCRENNSQASLHMSAVTHAKYGNVVYDHHHHRDRRRYDGPHRHSYGVSIFTVRLHTFFTEKT